ncbi:peptide/nickel transport system ATP-binding protein [Cytobacillus horneckiae]|uniref:Dipeptide ABC transporter ATP-binding protein n=1 Tax=Cytobacillus horneckiae TaxID=549687 RepID=A0A2N0ZDN8_9BACI|nr:dipeptide ABC transporter ATP-binding protein [Cytobacillus horneckiae]MBN6884969.1 dipeptide ABC transporter ATP-binding protein [Cytobacillus horneckiae]MCM3179285.1 dipeptide ABC transporter ATP-binding protein [Cytobacillus horneckiae]MEC1154507.1 dipeptide ABC transporter ATP-binding protein [Cytobacillus horneckiae]MED2937842.1 dipeptide ABC transporter ATP-binding protein [Cytobacillus horneckiae]PKG27624.1 dipeptide ABC transporter ATP-binding protein [Cytobacillus horneckiae]
MAVLTEHEAEKLSNHKQVLLEVTGIRKYYPIRGGVLQRVQGNVKAVENVSLQLYEGESLGVVGESGCGKSTLGKAILGLEELTDGKIMFKGKEIQNLKKKEKLKFIKEMQMIFQDPFASLNPRQRIGHALEEVFTIHTNMSAKEKKNTVLDLLKEVGLKEEHYDRYPHEFSGGQRQRIGIARAICLNPSFIICDEAVSALDVSVQAQVLKLLKTLQAKYQLSYMFISHDLGVVRYFCDRVLVMYLGHTVELGSVEDLFNHPLHPYTQALLSAIPRPTVQKKRKRIRLEGDLPNPADPPGGCPFHTRCPIAQDKCKQEKPEWKEYGSDHFAACHFAGQSILA